MSYNGKRPRLSLEQGNTEDSSGSHDSSEDSSCSSTEWQDEESEFSQNYCYSCNSVCKFDGNILIKDEDESFYVSQHSKDNKSVQRAQLIKQVTDLVNALVEKYKIEGSVTKLEILGLLNKRYRRNFHWIFNKVSKRLTVIYGIDIRKESYMNNTYVLVKSLDLTYEDEDLLTDSNRMPTNGFLILILGIIFMEGNCVSEENIWGFLSIMGVYDGEEHFIYGEPRKLLTCTYVEADYLEYRQIANSNSPCYEFLWGPRAHAETTKMKVLEFIAILTGKHPVCYLSMYEEALRDEEARAQNNPQTSDAVATIAQPEVLDESEEFDGNLSSEFEEDSYG